MLVLSRKKDESIVIGEDVVVTVVEIRGDKVRLGVQAPREVSVHRREIYEKIKRSAPSEGGPPSEAQKETGGETRKETGGETPGTGAP
jgi:carbon storage regulator